MTMSSVASLLAGYSIEVMPRTAAKLDRIEGLFPPGTRVYVAHVEGTPIADMVATAARFRAAGHPVMPHIPARFIRDLAMFEDWLRRYRDDAGVDEALVLAGGATVPAGRFDSAMQLLETGLFDRHDFGRLHVAGHPEGSRDIDPDGSTRLADAAVRWKQAFAERTGAAMALVTQFAFEAGPVIAWADRIAGAGVGLPVHVGIAGPARLQTMIRFAMTCGIGPSARVLHRRAKDLTKLLSPYEPTELLADFAAHREAHPDSPIRQLHFFPFGGIEATARYIETIARRDAAGSSGGRRGSA